MTLKNEQKRLERLYKIACPSTPLPQFASPPQPVCLSTESAQDPAPDQKVVEIDVQPSKHVTDPLFSVPDHQQSAMIPQQSATVSKRRMYGVALDQVIPPVSSAPPIKKAKIQTATGSERLSSGNRDQQESVKEYDSDNFVDCWVPPKGSTRDGKNLLNDKYGY